MIFATADAVYSFYVLQKYIRVSLLSVISGKVIISNISRDMVVQSFGIIWDLMITSNMSLIRIDISVVAIP